MVFVILGVLLLLIGLPLWMFGKKVVGYYGGTTYGSVKSAGAVLSVLGIIALVLTFLIFLGGYYGQVKDLSNIERYEADKSVYVTRATDLTDRFKALLAQDYPEYEERIFNKITPSNLQVAFIMYPQLRNIEGINKLVEQIRELQDSVYEQDIKINEVRKKITIRSRDILQLGFLYPDE
jgi:hypothetical protein